MQCTRTKRKSQHFQTVITYHGRELLAKTIILPATPAPHVSADSPRFLEPGHVAELIYYSLYDDDGKEVTGHYFLDREQHEIEKLIMAEWTIDQTAARVLVNRILYNSSTLAEVNARRGYPQGEPA